MKAPGEWPSVPFPTKLFVGAILKAERNGWSRQGLGMLRLYLDPERVYRLHVWDSCLRNPDVSPMHTHPWDLESTIIAGVYQQRRYKVPRLVDLGRSDIRTATFNKVRIQCGEGACTKEEPTKVELQLCDVETVLEGQTYTQSKDEIHESFPLNGTVTLTRRTFHPDREHADIYWPGNGPWIDAKPEIVPADSPTLKQVLERSLASWF